jgi:1-acyl-sn-glycerol-3-phosphate acyltransferase
VIVGAIKSLAILFHTLIGSLGAFLCGAVARSEDAAGRVMEWWGRGFIRLGGWRVRTEGLDRLPEGGGILVSNHQSLVDIPLLLAAFPREIKFLAKRELGQIPLFGKAMRYAGNLFIDRDDPRDAVHLMREAVRRIEKRQFIVVFPEGTRSPDGEIGEFKPGAFYIATKAGVPVLPVYIDGGRHALPKGSLLFRPAEMVVRVLEPLSPEGGGFSSRQSIAEEARRRILSARAEERESNRKRLMKEDSSSEPAPTRIRPRE